MNDIVPVSPEEVPTLEPIPAVVNVTVHTAYFDADGKLLIITSGGVMDPPGNAAYSQEVSDPLNFDIYYDGEAKQKQPFTLTNVKNKLSGIPVGTSVYTSDSAEVVDDGEVEFVVNFDGKIDLFLDHPRYLSESVTVEVGP